MFNEATEMPPPLPGTTRLLSSPDDTTLALLGVDILLRVEAKVWWPLCSSSLFIMDVTVANFEVMRATREMRKKCETVS